MHMRKTKKYSQLGFAICIRVLRARPGNSKGESLFAKTNTEPLYSSYGECAGKNALGLCSWTVSQKKNLMVQVSYFWHLTKTSSSLNTHKLHLVLPSTRNIHLSKGFPLEVTEEVMHEVGIPRGGSALLHFPTHFLQRRLPLPQQLLQPLDFLIPYCLIQVRGSHREGIISERTFQNRSILFRSH